MFHTQLPQTASSSWESKNTQDDYLITQKFQQQDKNRDGLLSKNEFRAFLKDVFSFGSNQFVSDAIEEIVWRTQRIDLDAAKHAISSINDLSVSTPYNAQGQQVQAPQVNKQFNTTQNKTTSSQSFNPFDSFNPFSSNVPASLPPPPASYNSTPSNLPPMASLPPPPIANSALAGVGTLRSLPPRPAVAPTQSVPSLSSVPVQSQQTTNTSAPMLPTNIPAMPYASAPFNIQTQGVAPIRVLPQGPAVSQQSLTSTAKVSEEESRAFIEYINTNTTLLEDPEVKRILPIGHNSTQIYTVVSEGWLLCKMLNAIQPEAVPSHHIKLNPKNAFERIENHTLAINAARKLGCKTVNIGPEDLLQGKPSLVLGLLWQIIKRDVLSKVSLVHHPEIYRLAGASGNLKEIQESTPEQVLLKWANHHLQKTNRGVQMSNFSEDVRDGSTYTLLMNQIRPDICTVDALRESDAAKRAQMIVENARKLNCDRFVTANDIINGNSKLNLAFVADLFNKHSGLELPTLQEMERLKKQNASMSNVLDEAEARLRQILADGRLAHELQQEEILLYRQRKLKEQEQLAEQEAMLRAQLQQEEMMLVQQGRMRSMSLEEQERFAREEQRKEDMKAGRPRATSSSSTLSARNSTPASTSSIKPTLSTQSKPLPSSVFTDTTAPIQPTQSYVKPSSTYSAQPSSYTPATTTYPSTTPSYAPSASSYPSATPYPAATASSYPSSVPSYAPVTQAYSAQPTTSSYDPYTVNPSYSVPQTYASSYPPTQSYAPSGYSDPYAANPPHPIATGYPPNTSYANYYPSQTQFQPQQPQSQPEQPQFQPQQPQFQSQQPQFQPQPVDTTYTSTTHTIVSNPLSAYEVDDEPIIHQSRHRGMFERVGKKFDRAFH